MNHKPGPWRWTDIGNSYQRLVSDAHPYPVLMGFLSKDVHGTGAGISVLEPDARLIAAAPELLAALETVKRVLQGEMAFDIMLGVDGPCLGEVVRDAITKARGE